MFKIDIVKKILYKCLPFLERHNSVRQFMKFCIIGSTNVAIDFSIYFILTRLFKIYFIIANVGSFLCAITWSFYMNKRWTFRHALSGDMKKKYIKFFIVNAIGVTLQTLILYILVTFGEMHDLLSKCIAIVLVTFWNFFASKYWVFKI